MEISDGITAARYDVTVAAKVQQNTREQGRQALQLIESASTPRMSLHQGVGTRLNVVA
jgi:hypothetical protein